MVENWGTKGSSRPNHSLWPPLLNHHTCSWGEHRGEDRAGWERRWWGAQGAMGSTSAHRELISNHQGFPTPRWWPYSLFTFSPPGRSPGHHASLPPKGEATKGAHLDPVSCSLLLPRMALPLETSSFRYKTSCVWSLVEFSWKVWAKLVQLLSYVRKGREKKKKIPALSLRAPSGIFALT